MGRLGDRGVSWHTGWPVDDGPVWPRVCMGCWGLVGEGAGGWSGCGVFEREEVRQDLRRGKASVG